MKDELGETDKMSPDVDERKEERVQHREVQCSLMQLRMYTKF